MRWDEWDEDDNHISFIDTDIEEIFEKFEEMEDELDEEEAMEPLLLFMDLNDISLDDTSREKLKLKNALDAFSYKTWMQMSKRQKKRLLKRVFKSKEFSQLQRQIDLAKMQSISNEIEMEQSLNTKKEDLQKPVSEQVTLEETAKNFGYEARDKIDISPPEEVIANMTDNLKESVETAISGGTTEVVKAAKKVLKKTAKYVTESTQKENVKANEVLKNSDNLMQNKANQDTDNVPKHIGKIAGLTSGIMSLITSILSAIGTGILIPLATIVAIVFVVISTVIATYETPVSVSNIALSSEVLSYKEMVEKYAGLYGVLDYVPYLLAIMQVESGGKGNDVMQSSESLGLAPGSLEPEASIEQGVKYFSNLLSSAQSKGCDILTVVQAYNYGGGFIKYVKDNSVDKKYTFELAEAFANEKSKGKKVIYKNSISINKNGGWRYAYGNMFYVMLVQQYVLSESVTEEQALDLLSFAFQFQGKPYKMGGTDPNTGIDCSAFTQYCYKHIGIDLPRTAQQQYDFCTHISSIDEAKPGDLVFYTQTYDSGNYITHVELYVGNGKTFGAGNPIGFHDLNSNYYKTHFVCFGRVAQ